MAGSPVVISTRSHNGSADGQLRHMRIMVGVEQSCFHRGGEFKCKQGRIWRLRAVNSFRGFIVTGVQRKGAGVGGRRGMKKLAPCLS